MVISYLDNEFLSLSYEREFYNYLSNYQTSTSEEVQDVLNLFDFYDEVIATGVIDTFFFFDGSRSNSCTGDICEGNSDGEYYCWDVANLCSCTRIVCTGGISQRKNTLNTAQQCKDEIGDPDDSRCGGGGGPGSTGGGNGGKPNGTSPPPDNGNVNNNDWWHRIIFNYRENPPHIPSNPDFIFDDPVGSGTIGGEWINADDKGFINEGDVRDFVDEFVEGVNELEGQGELDDMIDCVDDVLGTGPLNFTLLSYMIYNLQFFNMYNYIEEVNNGCNESEEISDYLNWVKDMWVLDSNTFCFNLDDSVSLILDDIYSDVTDACDPNNSLALEDAISDACQNTSGTSISPSDLDNALDDHIVNGIDNCQKLEKTIDALLAVENDTMVCSLMEELSNEEEMPYYLEVVSQSILTPGKSKPKARTTFANKTPREIRTRFSKDICDSSCIYLASSAIHEVLHAEFVRETLSALEHIPESSYRFAMFSNVWNTIVHDKYGDSTNANYHYIMERFYVDEMSKVLWKLNNELGNPGDYAYWPLRSINIESAFNDPVLSPSITPTEWDSIKDNYWDNVHSIIDLDCDE